MLGSSSFNSDNTLSMRTEYVRLDDMPIAQITTLYGSNNVIGSRRTTYIHTDHLNTPRTMTDSTKKVVWHWEGDAYGSQSPNQNPDGDTVIDVLNLRFPGQTYDSETGLLYNVHRYYDPITGRYTQSDPIGLLGGMNTYAYVNGNPISLVDPLGLSGTCFALNAASFVACTNNIDNIYPDSFPHDDVRCGDRAGDISACARGPNIPRAVGYGTCFMGNLTVIPCSQLDKHRVKERLREEEKRTLCEGEK